MFIGSKPACWSSACKYNRLCMLSALSKNVLINFKPWYWSSPVPPPLFSMPANRRNRTGSPQRKRNVDSASDTDVWPLWTLFGELWTPAACLSHAVVSNCNASRYNRSEYKQNGVIWNWNDFLEHCFTNWNRKYHFQPPTYHPRSYASTRCRCSQWH